MASSIINSSMLLVCGAETRWNHWVRIMLNILTWRIRLESIPAMERLWYRRIEVHSIMCLVCHSTVKTIDYLFVGCRDLIDIWSRITIWWDIKLPEHLSVLDLIS